MATDIDFPSELPCAMRQGYNLNHISPFKRTEMSTGRARQRRTFTSVPTMVDVQWMMTTEQAVLFESWFKYKINDGADWFNTELKTPTGLQQYECRFTEMYEGPTLTGTEYWLFNAKLEIIERSTMREEWLDAPEYVIGMDIFDLAMNREWPI